MTKLIPAGLGTLRDALAQARFTTRAEFVRGRNAADSLLRLVEEVYSVRPSMHGDHGPIPEECRFCDGEAAGLAKIHALITNFLTYTDLDEEPAR